MPAYSLGGSSAWAVTSHSDQTITGAKVFQQGAEGVPLTLKSISTNTSPLMSWDDDTGTRRGYIHTNGGVFTDNGSYIQAGWGTGVSRLSTSGQQYGLVQMFNNTTPGVDNAILGRVLGYGYSTAGTLRAYTDQRAYIGSSVDGAEWAHYRFFTYSAGTSSETLRLGDSYASAWLWSRSTTQRGLVVRGIASQTVPLQQWENSAGTALGAFTAEGRIQIGNITTFTGSASLGIVSTDPTLSPIRVRGAASQTSSLTQWQNSAGSVLAQIDAAGNLYSPIIKPLASPNAASTIGSGGDWAMSGPKASPAAGIIGFGDGTGWRLEWWRGGGAGPIAYMTDGGAWYAAAYNGISARATKDEITYLGETKGMQMKTPLAEKFKKLKPVSYKSRAVSPDSETNPTLYSFVAEEAAEVMPEIVAMGTRENKDEIEGINLSALTTLQTAIIQELIARVESLEARLEGGK